MLAFNLPNSLSRLLTTIPGRTLLIFLFLYLLLGQYCRYAFYRDPTSAFFDPSRAYEHIYSLQRQRQADAFIQAANSSSHAKNGSQVPRPATTMCLGIATVERPGEQYIRLALGSLMEGLTEDERKQIYAVILIGHTDPERHPIYHEPWLQTLSDKILTYDTLRKDQFDLLSHWEHEKDYRRKAIFDYTHLLETCLQSGAAWIAMIEDDTIAVAGWYPRTLAALDVADAQNLNRLYLRLFFTEQYLGWNRESWPTYLLASLSVVICVASTLVALRNLGHYPSISGWTIFTAAFVCTPAFILLYFLAGKLSMRPLPPGVHEMPNYGCCAQGLVFSPAAAARAVDQLKETELGFVDMILEAWADAENLARFAVVPSLLQHVGGRSSKGDDFGVAAAAGRGMAVAERIFSFGFEVYERRGDGVVYPLILRGSG
ncbi:MAG: hypothetical protein Q9182_001334 [Xanthomendoza sp. 2 TL-2023]